MKKSINREKAEQMLEYVKSIAKYMHGGATKQSLGPILHFLEIGSILGPLLQGIQQGR